jgi:GTP-binding protein
MSLLFTARFHDTVAELRTLPRGGAPEVAFIGRSNAGKSSAINVLCQRKRLAFSSRTPGRTQSLNFFAVGRDDRIDGFLVDMPGYGFAAAPGAIRQAWDALAGRYLRDRTELAGAVLMVDIRRQLTDSDRRMIEWLPRGLPLVVLLTKCDKFGSSQQSAARRKVVAQLAELGVGGSGEVLLFSAVARTGIDAARTAIEALVGADADAQKKTPTKGSVGV